MKQFYVLIVFLLVSANGMAQVEDVTTEVNAEPLLSQLPNKVVYFSIGGPALTVLSLHYEQKLKNKFWGRVGFSYAPFLLEGYTVPIGLSYLKGENVHYLELGVGTTFIYTKEGWHFSFFDDDSIEDHFLIALNSSIGYRYQPVDKKLFFKINFTPSFLPMNSEVIPILGIGVGTSL
ncbi:hypothetical protein [Gracilimonas mengyeensis]|uniref:Outer membrane protein beta-barrel domain-containing protein n=1 Tax=Gracilimonas mengyeensis TaxID=1302730 RepID=A0A521FNT2_9BACT|nr:hypothetical protein [Gracilimonas mengyeensis]SMO97857.1 hypothetical protein SAMN06265219_1292 [Gracilimonas mengyeensis]